jgi:hypothetical protein
MPTPPPDRSRRSLSHGQEMFLLYGPADRWGDAFADEWEVYESWNQHRARILGRYRGGRRPWAWWAFESGRSHPGNHEASTLYAMGVFSDEEYTEVVAGGTSNICVPGVPISSIAKAPGASLRARLPGASTTPGLTSQRTCSCNGRRSAGAGVGQSARSRP